MEKIRCSKRGTSRASPLAKALTRRRKKKTQGKRLTDPAHLKIKFREINLLIMALTFITGECSYYVIRELLGFYDLEPGFASIMTVPMVFFPIAIFIFIGERYKIKQRLAEAIENNQNGGSVCPQKSEYLRQEKNYVII